MLATLSVLVWSFGLAAQAAEPMTLCVPTGGADLVDPPRTLHTGEVLSLRLGETHAQLIAVGEDRFAGDEAFLDERDSTYLLLLQHIDPSGDRLESQILFSGPRTAAPQVSWAGDLDADGSPDLVLEPAGDAPPQRLLWLSSMAQGEELVHRVGVVQRGGGGC